MNGRANEAATEGAAGATRLAGLPKRLAGGRHPLAGVVAACQLVNLRDGDYRFHTGLLLPAGRGETRFIERVVSLVDSPVRVSGEGTDFETLIGTVEGSEVSPGLVFADEPGIVVIERAGALPLRVQLALSQVVEEGRYTFAMDGVHAELSTEATIICLSNPRGADWDDTAPPLEQVEMEPRLLCALDAVVVDGPGWTLGVDQMGDENPSAEVDAEALRHVQLTGVELTQLASLDLQTGLSEFQQRGHLRGGRRPPLSQGTVSEECIEAALHALTVGLARLDGSREAIDDHSVPARLYVEAMLDRLEAPDTNEGTCDPLSELMGSVGGDSRES